MNISSRAARDTDYRASGNILIAETRDDIRYLTLNRPEARNALSRAMTAKLQSALDDAADDARIGVVVIRGEGPVFCAGHDIRELVAARKEPDGGEAFFRETFQASSRLMQSIVNHVRPVIADIRGTATAAGCQLAASCDLAIASEEAQFATPGVNIGLFCSTPMVALSRKIGRNHAMEMLLTGEPVSAQRAAETGLVSRVFPAASMDAQVHALATAIAFKPRATVETGKRAFYRQAELPLAEAYALAADVMADNMLHHDSIEGMTAFIEKRKPKWRAE